MQIDSIKRTFVFDETVFVVVHNNEKHGSFYTTKVNYNEKLQVAGIQLNPRSNPLSIYHSAASLPHLCSV